MILDYHFSDFIGFYKTNIDCQPFIDHFNYLEKTKSIFDYRGVNRRDKQAYIHDLTLPDSIPIFSEYNRLTHACLEIYLDNYNKFSEIGHFQQPYLKIQKTDKCGGFHNFHAENLQYNTHNRIMVSMLYLNDVEEGGETEFLFLSKRIKAEKGTFLIFPGSYTHMHRGNPPLSGEKYIVTSWIEKRNVDS